MLGIRSVRWMMKARGLRAVSLEVGGLFYGDGRAGMLACAEGRRMVAGFADGPLDGYLQVVHAVKLRGTFLDRLRMLGDVTEEAEGIWRTSCPANPKHGRKLIVTREVGSGRLRVCCHGGCDLPLLFRALQVEIKNPTSYFEAVDQKPTVQRGTSPEGVAGFCELAATLDRKEPAEEKPPAAGPDAAGADAAAVPPRPKHPSGFVLVSAAALAEEPEEKIAYVWEGVLPVGGLAILGAKPKVGKSTLVRTLIGHMVRGEPFLGRATVPGGGRVLYLALEDKRAELRRALTLAGVIDERVLLHVGRAPEDALFNLRQAIAASKVDLVVVDTLAKLVRMEDLNNYAEVNRKMEDLMDIARTTSCSILCLHHLNKAAGGDLSNGGDGLLGLTALFGAVDAFLEMHNRNGSGRTLKSTQRYGTDLPETVLHLDTQTGLLYCGGRPTEPADVRNEALLAVIREHGGERGIVADELAARVTMQRARLLAALRELAEGGRVLRTGHGNPLSPYRYRLPPVEGGMSRTGPIEPVAPAADGVAIAGADFALTGE